MIANGSLSRLSHVISRLEGRDWVRRRSGTGVRGTYVELTDQGYQKPMETGPFHLREVRRLVFDVLTPEEVKALRQVAARINGGLLGQASLGRLAPRTRKRARREST